VLGWLQSLATEFGITASDPAVWLSIGEGLLFGAVCLVFGVWVTRFVGLLEPDAPAGETLGVGMASGLLVLAAWWAAIASGGRSSFTPVAVGFGMAIVLGVARRRRSVAAGHAITTAPTESIANDSTARSVRVRNLIAAVLGGGTFIAAVALLYGSTLTLSPRDGVQPLEFNDEAYYSVLGADLAKTGTESLYSPSGFAVLDGLPVQTWYHWGELWLASAVITVFGAAPLAARHLVVLPILLLAAAAMTGTLVRRMTRSTSRGAFLFGFLACLFLAPVPLIQGPLLGALTVGMIFGITAYGLVPVAFLLALYSLIELVKRQASWTLATFVASAAALIIPAHVVVALLGLVGIGTVWTIRIGKSLVATRHLPVLLPVWRRTFVTASVAILATVGWGLFTGHGVAGAGVSPGVSPFNAVWRDAVALTTLGAGALLATAVAWLMVRKETSLEADLYLGTAALLVTGALAWGARLGDLSMAHLLVAGIAVFAMPSAAVAVWSIWRRLRATGHRRRAVALLVLCAAQMEFGVAMGIVRLQSFGPGAYEPVPTQVLAGIRALPADAKLAYACRPSEEVAFWEPRLLSLDAHAARRIVPMCFEADTFGSLLGAPSSADIPNLVFQWAPQHALYPKASVVPSTVSVASFLKENGIDYIYADALHPNSLVPGAIPIATSGETQVLRIP
jgi:hypothetical protein